MEEKDRQVKGIWIPIDIWKDDNLNWSEKILFIEIDSFTSNKKDCFISNEYISKLLGVSETSANKILSSLIKKGYVIKTAFDGRRRFVKSALTININQPCEKVQGSIEFNDNILNIDTNIDNNKEDIDKSISKKVEEEFIERMYLLYPSKCPKRNTSLNKSYKDKERIRKLLKIYSMDDIEKVITYEVNEKYNKN